MATHTIRKVTISAFSSDANVVNVISAPIEPPAKNEVQCDVLYAGFSGADINMRLGSYPQQRAAPLTPGYCFVGRVSANGPKSTKYEPGTLVAALTTYDSEAEKINIPEKYLVPVPSGVDIRQALALVLDWNTAYGLVHRAAKVTKGQRVFIHGLSGAVGYGLMKLSMKAGAIVYGTASERNHDELRALGAIPFTYKDKAWMDRMRELGGAHVIFDPLGFESWNDGWETLCRDEPSILVGFGGNMNVLNPGDKPRSQMAAIARLYARNGCLTTKRSTTFYYIDRDRANFLPDLQELLRMLEAGEIAVPIKAVWDMENIREPHSNWGKIPGMGSCLVRVAAPEPPAYNA